MIRKVSNTCVSVSEIQIYGEWKNYIYISRVIGWPPATNSLRHNSKEAAEQEEEEEDAAWLQCAVCWTQETEAGRKSQDLTNRDNIHEPQNLLGVSMQKAIQRIIQSAKTCTLACNQFLYTVYVWSMQLQDCWCLRLCHARLIIMLKCKTMSTSVLI